MQNQEVYGTWKILYKAEGKDMYHCKCIKCNVVEKDIRCWTLREKPPVCECMNTDLAVQKEIEQRYVNEPDYKKLGARAHNLYGKTFGSWEVLYYVGDRKWRCRCNTISDIVGYTLEAGKSKGHNKSALIDETGNVYGKDLKKWRCQCECGNIHYVTAKDLRNHDVTSCGRCYKGQNLKGMHFGEWEVLRYAGDFKWHCRCSCGTERDVLAQNLLNGRSGEKKAESFKSTMMDRYGELNWKRIDMPRQRWQVETLASKDKLIAFIKQLENSLGHRVTYTDLANKLDTSYRAITSRIYEYDIRNLIDVGGNRSIKENELYINLKASNNVRDVIPSCELDIYIPDSRIAVEFNGIINMSKKEVYCRCSLDKPLHAREIEQLGGKILKISDPTYVWVTNEGELSNGYTKSDLEILNKYPGMTYDGIKK